jgi:hypothetical protein
MLDVAAVEHHPELQVPLTDFDAREEWTTWAQEE